MSSQIAEMALTLHPATHLPEIYRRFFDNRAMLVPADDSRAAKDARSRLSLYADWLEVTERRWYQPDLVGYAAYAMSDERTDAMGQPLRPLAATAMRSHLGTIRARYRTLTEDNGFRDVLYAIAAQHYAGQGDQKAWVDEAITRIENELRPGRVKISITQHQDEADSVHLRLTSAQADSLLRSPDPTTLMGLRDLAMIALMLCTGIREGELCHLEVQDLRQRLGGELALHVREGKGNKSRLVPYGDLDWALDIVARWLQLAGITHGAMFRGFYKGGNSVRENALTERAVQKILAQYPISINGEQILVRPHDLRRTYARRLFEAGMDVVAIQQNLGHADLKTTLRYIGSLDADKRRGRGVYQYDMGRLPGG